MGHQGHLLKSEALAELFEIFDERGVGDLGWRTNRRAERAALVVQHELVLVCERADGRQQIAVLRAPAAVQHDDHVSGGGLCAVLRDVMHHLVRGVHVPLLDGHTGVGGEGREPEIGGRGRRRPSRLASEQDRERSANHDPPNANPTSHLNSLNLPRDSEMRGSVVSVTRSGDSCRLHRSAANRRTTGPATRPTFPALRDVAGRVARRTPRSRVVRSPRCDTTRGPLGDRGLRIMTALMFRPAGWALSCSSLHGIAQRHQ